jgi:ribonuclease HI
MAKFTIYTDGAARGNPGASASGFSVYDSSGKKIHARSHYNGKRTNNFAEYTAVIRALEWCADNLQNPNEAEILLYSDSELIVRQLTGEYKIKNKAMLLLNESVKELIPKFKSISFHNLPREDEHIAEVDRGLNRLLDEIYNRE